MVRRLILFVTLLTFLPFARAFAASSILPMLMVTVLPANGGSIPAGAQRVTMLSLELQASCASDVSLLSMRVHHQGLGDSADIDRMYLMSNGLRITRSLSVNREDQSATLQLHGWTIPACGTRTVDVVGDFSSSASAAGEHAFALMWPSDISSQGNVKVTLQGVPSATRARSTSGSAGGSVAVESLSLLEQLTYGVHLTVATIRLTASGPKDQLLTGITFTNDGSARDGDLRNFFLESGDHRHLTPPAAQMQGRIVRLEFSPPFLLRAHEKTVLNLIADIRAGRRRTVDFVIEEPGDLEAAGCAGMRGCLQAH